MLTQFFGAIEGSNGNPYAGYGNSGNFTSRRTDKGQYTITLNQWIAAQPIVCATPRGDSSDAKSIKAQATYDSDTYAYTVGVYTFSGSNRHDVDFYFSILTGSNVTVAGTTVQFDLSILSFQGTPTLVASCNGTYLDKGTVLLLSMTPTQSVTLELHSSQISYGGNTYNLTAYSNSAGSNEPTLWDDNKQTLPATPAGTRYGFESLTFVATNASNPNDVLFTDPIARVRTVGG